MSSGFLSVVDTLCDIAQCLLESRAFEEPGIHPWIPISTAAITAESCSDAATFLHLSTQTTWLHI